MKLYEEAIRRFKKLLAKALKTGLNEPTAMTLATADSKGWPSARVVLLKEVDARGFVFYTNLESRKGQQLGVNPRAALCFFWDTLMEQVLIEGKVERVSESQADAYWKSRPRESQIASYVSLQSKPLDGRQTLEAKVSECKRKFAGRAIPRPVYWSGCRVVPDRVEFWRARPFRLNERVLYQKTKRGWTETLLYP